MKSKGQVDSSFCENFRWFFINKRHALVMWLSLIGQYFSKTSQEKLAPPFAPLTLHLKSPTQVFPCKLGMAGLFGSLFKSVWDNQVSLKVQWSWEKSFSFAIVDKTKISIFHKVFRDVEFPFQLLNNIAQRRRRKK